MKIRTVMDSGAAESVAPPSMAPQVSISVPPGSKRGQHYVSASAGRLINMGQQLMRVQTNEGRDAKVVYPIAEVSRPLTAVSATCDQGNWVVYTPHWGVHYELRVRAQDALRAKWRHLRAGLVDQKRGHEEQ